MNEQDKLSSFSESLKNQSELEKELLRELTIKRNADEEFNEAFEGIHFHHCRYCGEDYECEVTEVCCYSRTKPCYRCHNNPTRRLSF